MKLRHVLSGALLIVSASSVVHAQALTSITSLYVGYSTRKATAKPTGELKVQLDSVDRELGVATQQGRTSEVRRLLARGMTLLAGRAWTDVADFDESLLLRTDRVVVESQKPYAMRLEQLYAPAINLTRSLTAHATLTGRGGASGAAAQAVSVIKELGTFDGVSRDLRDSPQLLDFDLRGVPDGRYTVVVEVLDSARTLGSASLPILVRSGLDETVAQLESAAAKAPEALRAEILYPVDRMRNVNRGKLELRTFDATADFASAEKVVAAVKSGKDPFAGRTGDIKRHYLLKAANEIMPYRTYVPTTYKATVAAPLIIALHGLGGTEDAFFDGYGKKLPQLAEQSGYLIAAPLGYRVDGSYGWGVGSPPADVTTRRREEYSDADVMQVLAQMKQQYNIDVTRIYLLGHSMGAIGTWKLAAKYADVWAAIAPFSGQGAPSTVDRMKGIPNFVVHGDADPTVNVRGSRAMVEAMKALNMDVTYIEVPGGNHSAMVEPNLPGAVEFFNKRRKGGAK
ncbi:MAG: dienelactone hydrolase family protein [Phycisphaerae bacterium]|nr:dienelactone hydrolase family protein [Gemmatimonadaceae bacterium]